MARIGVVRETQRTRCCARCGLTPYEARRPENKECWAPGMPMKYATHLWIWWEPTGASQETEGTE